MEKKYTPGPWNVQNDFTIWGAEIGKRIAYVDITHKRGYETEEGKNNAKLIASAPELLEACMAANQCIDDALEIYKRGGSLLVLDEAMKSLKNDAGKLVKAAINKAIH